MVGKGHYFVLIDTDHHKKHDRMAGSVFQQMTVGDTGAEPQALAGRYLLFPSARNEREGSLHHVNELVLFAVPMAQGVIGARLQPDQSDGKVCQPEQRSQMFDVLART